MRPLNHDLITRSAFGRLPPEYPLFKRQIDAVVLGNLLSDANLASSGVHYDNCAFSEGSARIASCWAGISSEADRFSQRALQAFGGLLHTTQDFYSHSNWVELHKLVSPIPLWDLAVGSLPAGVFSGTVIQAEPKKCGPGTPDHDDLNKDDDRSDEGKRVVDGGPNDGKTYYELAFQAAVEASARQLERFVSGVACYRITTRTGPSLFSGTDAQVFIVLEGGGRKTGRMRLNNPGENDFERGNIDTFLVGTTVGLDQVEKITIGYETESGAFPGWYLEDVVVERVDEDGRWKFRCGRWLAKGEGDGKTILELGAE